MTPGGLPLRYLSLTQADFTDRTTPGNGKIEMSKFEKTRWTENEFSRNYRDDANIYLPFRSQFFEITKSFYEHFISQNIKAKILDLGCGDGLFSG